jgi:hypothetical protein
MHWAVEQSISDAGRAGDPSSNEDHCGAVGNISWVLDGAGLGKAPRFEGFQTDAAWLVAEVSRWLTARGETNEPLPDLLAALQTHLTSAFGDRDDSDPSGGPSACLTLARVNAHRHVDLAWIADTVTLVADQQGRITAITDDRVTPFEAKTFAIMHGVPRVDGALPPDARAQIVRNRHEVNQPGGYAVISPMRPWAHLVRYASFALPKGKPLVLMSDGFSRLFDTFHALTMEQVYAAAADGQARALLDTLRALEQADPDASRYIRFKIHDDATLLVVRPLE